LDAIQALSQLSYGPVLRECSGGRFYPCGGGQPYSYMAEKTDYSPVVEEAGDAEKRRERRKWGALLTGAHIFWIYAAILAGIILLVIYLTGGFGVGSD
jgi:hypothetical protein